VADDGGISLGELAEQRSISKDAARRLVKAGRVSAHQVAGSHGPAWCVHPDADAPDRHGGAGDAPGLRNGPATVARPEDVAALVALVDRLTMENRELVGAVAAWQSQAVVLAGRLADAEQRLAIGAPSESTLVGPGAPESAGAALGPSGLFSVRWPAWAPWLLTLLAIVATIGLLGRW
jgi:hypothetical protein